MFGLEGKVAVITGGAMGIGEACARALAGHGAKVILADIAQEAVHATAADIAAAGHTALAIVADATRKADAAAMVALAMERFGRLDCAVNCAGGASRDRPLTERTEEDWRAQIEVNLMAPFFSMQEEIKAIRAGGRGGAIVNIASGSGLRGNANMTPYNAGKFGVVGLTRSAAVELGRENIRVNAVCPGPIATPALLGNIAQGVDYSPLLNSLPISRLGRPEEVGNACAWLCSDLASYITGVALPVDGGFMA